MCTETALVPADSVFLYFHILYISDNSFPSLQRHHWTVKCLFGHPGVCVWVRAPEAVSATAHVTSSCGLQMLASRALS